MQLAQHFLEQTCGEFGRDDLTLTQSQAENLRAYDWPGNIRELKNVIERAVILSTGKVLRLDLSMPGLRFESDNETDSTAGSNEVLTESGMRDFQRNNTIKALEQTNWKVSGAGGAADLLGVKPTTLADRIRTMKIDKPAPR